MADTLELLFKLKSEFDKRGTEEADSAIDKLTGTNTKLANSVKNVAAVGILAGTALLAVGAAAVTAGKAVFNLTTNFTKYVSEVGKANERTGVSVETLSALRGVAEETGVSFDVVNSALESYSKLIADAANGSENAKDKLERLGVDPQAAIKDLEGSLEAVLKRIVSLENPTARLAAAQDAFGDAGKELLPLLRRYDGDLEAVIQRARELGLVMSVQDVEAAKAFNRELQKVQATLKGAALTMGREFLPIVQIFTTEFSNFVTTNQKELTFWAQTAAIVFGRVIKGMQRVVDFVRNNSTALRIVAGILSGGQTEFAGVLIGKLAESAERDRKAVFDRAPGAQGSNAPDPFFNDKGAADRAAREQERRRKEREAQASKDMAARIAHARNEVSAIQDEFRRGAAELEKELRDTGATQGFGEAFNALVQQFRANIKEAEEYLFTLESTQAKNENFSKAQIALLVQEQKQRQKNIDLLTDQTTNRAADLEAEVQKRATEATLQERRNAADKRLQLAAAVNDTEMAMHENMLAIGSINEEQFLAKKHALALAELQFRQKVLTDLLEQAKGNKEEEARLQHELQLIGQAIHEQRLQNSTELANKKKADAEQEKREAEELAALKLRVIDAERESLDFRAEQERKILVNMVEFGRDRLAALEDLRAFDIAEAERKKQEVLADLEEQKKADLEKVKSHKNKKEKEEEINKLFRERELLAEEEFQRRLKEIEDGFNDAVPKSPIENLLGGLLGQGEGDVFAGIGDMITQSLNSMAQAAGNAVAAFVKFGSAGGSFRKFAAEIIAEIARMATVQAVWNLAEGFAKLALAFFGHPTAGLSATQHFTAAAVYGGIAGVAAIAGRGVAGNAFQSQTGGSGSSLGSAIGDTAGTSGGTSPITESRSTRQESTVVHRVDLRLDRGIIGEAVREDFDNGGETRGLLLNIVEGT